MLTKVDCEEEKILVVETSLSLLEYNNLGKTVEVVKKVRRVSVVIADHVQCSLWKEVNPH